MIVIEKKEFEDRIEIAFYGYFSCYFFVDFYWEKIYLGVYWTYNKRCDVNAQIDCDYLALLTLRYQYREWKDVG